MLFSQFFCTIFNFSTIPDVKQFCKIVVTCFYDCSTTIFSFRVIVSFDLNQNVNQDESFESDDEDEAHDQGEGEVSFNI